VGRVRARCGRSGGEFERRRVIAASEWESQAMMRVVSFVLGGVLATAAAQGAETAADLPNSRDEVRFTRHVIPLFSRLGCNAGTCHGKVQGENGFRLSLFGVEPEKDHGNLLREFAARRVNLSNVEASLLLLKPSGGVPHGGGKLIEPGGPEYRLLERWLAEGARLDPVAESRVAQLTVTPSTQTLKVGEKHAIRVEVRFGDGTSEDVTHLCRFEPVNRDVVAIAPGGEVEGIAVGDTAVVVRYGAEPAVASFVVPGDPVPFPDVAVHNFVDEHILKKLRVLNVAPADLCDDATFLRRASLDISGELPTAQEVRAFLADKSSSKRGKKIEELLRRPGHAALWATKFCDILRPSNFDGNFGMVEPAENRRFYEWVRGRLAENLPYDEFAARILTATSREGRPFEEWIDEVLAIAEENTRRTPELATYSRRHTLDLYWQRKDATGVKGTVQMAHAFLGLRLECAQCHRHPHDVWTQDDLLSFANFFNQLKGARYPDKKEMPEAIARMFEELPKEAKKLDEQLKQLREKDLRQASEQLNKTRDELNRAKAENKDADKIRELEEQLARQTEEKSRLDGEVAKMEADRGRMTDGPKRFGTNIRHDADRVNFASVSSPLGSQRSETFRLLGEDSLLQVAKDQDPRELVVAWLRRADNPYFARAIVNRVWAHYFGRGIIDPSDQLSPLNPPSHPELLDELARRFVENQYDLRWLHRTLAESRAYQLSSTPLDSHRGQLSAARRNFACFQLRRLPAEVLVDAVNDATGSREEYPAKLYLPEQARAIEVAGVTSRENEEAAVGYAFKIFGRPIRSTDIQCDCERDTNTTIVQTLYLANHPRVRDKIYSDNGRVAQIFRDVSENDRRIEEIYLAAVGRLPGDREREACLAYVNGRESSLRSFQDVLWSLLNTREFILNH
jgi:hypothetical protein